MWIMGWVNMCVKLHNFVTSMKDEWKKLDNIIELEMDEPQPRPPIQILRVGQATARLALPCKVMGGTLEYNRCLEGFLWQSRT